MTTKTLFSMSLCLISLCLGLFVGTTSLQAQCGNPSGVQGFCTYCYASFDCGGGSDSCEHDFCSGYITQECNFCISYFDHCQRAFSCCWNGGCLGG